MSCRTTLLIVAFVLLGCGDGTEQTVTDTLADTGATDVLEVLADVSPDDAQPQDMAGETAADLQTKDSVDTHLEDSVDTHTGEDVLTDADGGADTAAVQKMKLNEVRFWAYNIQEVDTPRQREQLVGTHFDLYVLEPVVTEKGMEHFDIASLLLDIRQHNSETRGVDPLILAYIDMGQAETWRWYWDDSWTIGDPEWIVGEDPDDWEGCYPVAYWHDTWKDIVIYGYGGRSLVEESLKAGFDGIYMDWVEAFSDVNVVEKAEADSVEPAPAMLQFIEDIRAYARFQSPNANPEYLVIAQNASDLYQEDPEWYRSCIDAIALEGIWYDGTGGFDDWDDPLGYNVLTNDLYPGYTEEVLGWLEPMKAYMPIFCVEYAQDAGGETYASEVYEVLAPAHGFVPYCSRRSLSQLSTTPYPPGYEPVDY